MHVALKLGIGWPGAKMTEIKEGQENWQEKDDRRRNCAPLLCVLCCVPVCFLPTVFAWSGCPQGILLAAMAG